MCFLWFQLTPAQLLPSSSRFRADIVGYGTARDEHSTFTCYTVHVTRLPNPDDVVSVRGVTSPVGPRGGGFPGTPEPGLDAARSPIVSAGACVVTKHTSHSGKVVWHCVWHRVQASESQTPFHQLGLCIVATVTFTSSNPS